MAKERKVKDRSANKPGRTMPNSGGGMSKRHVVNPAGTKIARKFAKSQGV